MPEKRTLKKARAAKRAGMSPSTQAGAFVHEEIEHVREGKHGARSTKQAIAIGLSKARRAGVKLPKAPSRTRTAGRRAKNSKSTVTTKALSRQAGGVRLSSRAARGLWASPCCATMPRGVALMPSLSVAAAA